ncbi:MAG TPA: glycosyltransferase family 4 protein [Woeseiaceae bacterium]|nr:glycosyltransferase family 4 protein [Woeseiaceae bacterium]
MESDRSKASQQRICHVNLSAGYRGGERQTELLVRDLAARGWPQRLVVRRGSALTERCRGLPGLEIVDVPPNPLNAAVAARGSALVHAHEARAVYAGWLLKISSGTPYVLTRRLHHAENGSVVRTRAYRASDCVVAISGSIAESVACRYEGMAITVVHDAHADMLNGHSKCRSALPGLAGKTVIGHLGELDHSHKGQGTIIEAARAMRESDPGVHFVLVGEGRDEQRLRRAAAGLDNVVFAGFVENVEEYLAAFDLFVYPSLYEGLGSSLLDAMAFGLPIAASNVGGIPEVVEHGVNGLLIPPDDAGALVGALRRLLSDSQLRNTMARENRARAAEFDTDRMTTAYESIYRSILPAG